MIDDGFELNNVVLLLEEFDVLDAKAGRGVEVRGGGNGALDSPLTLLFRAGSRIEEAFFVTLDLDFPFPPSFESVLVAGASNFASCCSRAASNRLSRVQ